MTYKQVPGDLRIPLVTVAEGGGGVWCGCPITGGLIMVEGCGVL